MFIFTIITSKYSVKYRERERERWRRCKAEARRNFSGQLGGEYVTYTPPHFVRVNSMTK